MKDIRKCPYCDKEIDCSKTYKSLNGHITGCFSNPKKVFIREKISSSRRRGDGYKKKRVLNCLKCKQEFEIQVTDKQFSKNNFRKHCSRICANSHIRTEESKKKTSDSIKRGLESRGFKLKEKPKCLVCGSEVRGQQNKYCSNKCSSQVKKGIKHREKLSKLKKEFYLKNPDKHPNRTCAGIKESYPERCFREFLEQNGLVKDKDFKKQKSIKPYFIDFYFPSLNIGVEIDGERWHKDLSREKKREEFLKSKIDLIRFKAMPLIKKEYENQILDLIKRVKGYVDE